ncbi:MAG: methylated-DNA--[protein]-cysteine S-methyltransferase [Proteobacteria bacterium]|jgi:methylated-DNA-[protein]-cysteine S-methyltransferase|nr:methylated-DNA--[protein]-cysteine S-methyltransferase [Pseudomonadota bacterium]
MELFWNILETSWGEILIVADHKGIVRITLPAQSASNSKTLNNLCKSRETILTHKNTATIAQAKKQIAEFLNGKRNSFHLELNPHGTDFQKKVWNALKRIPYGQTRCYQDIARSVGSPKAVRAVGMANNKNPLPLVIPCHRVIGKNGSLVGYAGGIPLKKKLLKLETEKAAGLKSSKNDSSRVSAQISL